jgi:drug/metabolite transporter (DMT)-like permease
VSWVRTLGILFVILGVILIVRSENRLDDLPLRDSQDH